ncbi:MAG: Nif3-like dinuclear metal center hexameric protein [Clostridia bacterium]|nr:Nif3-like dinuclear metal center hexameric protein [Clostridia bacterium]
MTVKELYQKMSERIPEELREAWDNDGLMCSADTSTDVHRALVSLDVTEEIVDYAIENGFDLIVSHHPLIFKPLGSLTEDSHVARKVIKLINNNISVFSFHTRADKVTGGVNDQLCDLIGLFDTHPFGEGGIGRIGRIDEECTLEDFVYRLKDQLGLQGVLVSDGYNRVSTIAVLGGDGKDYVKAALESGADTYISGRIGYNMMEEAAEMGINLIEAGHYFTEYPVTSFFSTILNRLDPQMYVEIADSNMIKLL